jgi:hypothetical protein
MRTQPKALTVRFSLPEFASIEQQARTQGKKPADWVRSRCIDGVEWHERLFAELLVTQQLVADLVREFVVYSSGDHEEAVAKVRTIFAKAEAARNQSTNAASGDARLLESVSERVLESRR